MKHEQTNHISHHSEIRTSLQNEDQAESLLRKGKAALLRAMATPVGWIVIVWLTMAALLVVEVLRQ